MIVIIGAGPAGLQLAYHLARKKQAYVVLEKDRIGSAWHNHYDSLKLHTLKEVSHLTGLAYPPEVGRFPTRRDVADYLVRYARTFQLNVQEGVEVKWAEFYRAQGEAGHWWVETTQGDYHAWGLVCATGIWNTPVTPPFHGQEQFSGEIMHAQKYKNPTPFLGRSCLIVGMGNTAADIAVELAQAGCRTGLSIRSGSNFVPYPRSVWQMQFNAWLFRTLPARLGNPLLSLFRQDRFSEVGLPPSSDPPILAYPVVGFELPHAVAAGTIKLHGEIAQLHEREVAFVDGERAQYDVLILATGYRPTLEFLAQGSVALDAQGKPIVSKQGYSHEQPRLYFLGYDYPATSGWIQNMRRQARQLANHLTPKKRW